MSKKIRNKLQSERGASLIMALLLFLVCMVVSSVLITAATASAGRLSQMVEMDKRYYAVTSAASTMTEQINEKTVTISNIGSEMTVEQVGGKTVDVSYTKDPSTGKWTHTATPGKDFQNFFEAFLTDQTVLLLDAEKNGTELSTAEYVMQPEDEADYQAQLKVKLTVQWKAAPERGILLRVENVVENGDVYHITLNCNADILERRSIVADGGTSAEQTLYEVKWSVPQFDN